MTIIRKSIQKHNILLRNHKGNEVDTVAYLLLTLDVVLFLSDKIVVSMTTQNVH